MTGAFVPATPALQTRASIRPMQNAWAPARLARRAYPVGVDRARGREQRP